MSLSSAAYREVDTIVSSWTSKYQYHISLLESNSKSVKLMVEFSLTKPEKPIPIGTVRVYFTCTCEDQFAITFRFEKDSLIHSIDKTIRHNQIEKWIDNALEKKLLVRKTVFYLGTSYEETRVQDQRLDKLLQQKPIVEKPEVCYIDPELLNDQKRYIDIMEKPIKDEEKMNTELRLFFREVDSENIGVVTRPEFLKIINNLGLKLSEKEEAEILKKADEDNTGTVDYSRYRQIVSEVLEAKQAKSSAEELLEMRKEEEMFTTILAFINDEAQEIEKDIVEHFKVGEEEEDTGMTNISEVKVVLEKINKKYKDLKQVEILSAIELAEITKILTDLHGYKSIPYRSIYDEIISFKIKTFSSGLINSKMNRLEIFIREICDKYDEKKFGKIKLADLIQALENCDKIKLTRAQIYLLESTLPLNEKGEVPYIECSKFLSQTIKKFYLYSLRNKQ